MQSMTEAEGGFMKKINEEVEMEEYDIYADYVEMVIQVCVRTFRNWEISTEPDTCTNSLDTLAFSLPCGR